MVPSRDAVSSRNVISIGTVVLFAPTTSKLRRRSTPFEVAEATYPRNGVTYKRYLPSHTFSITRSSVPFASGGRRVAANPFPWLSCKTRLRFSGRDGPFWPEVPPTTTGIDLPLLAAYSSCTITGMIPPGVGNIGDPWVGPRETWTRHAPA